MKNLWTIKYEDDLRCVCTTEGYCEKIGKSIAKALACDVDDLDIEKIEPNSILE